MPTERHRPRQQTGIPSTPPASVRGSPPMQSVIMNTIPTSVCDGLVKTSVKYTYDASGRVNSIQEFAGAVSRVICGGFNSSFYNGAATVPISDFWKLNGTSSGGSGVFYPQKQYRLSGRAWSQSAYKNAESRFELRAGGNHRTVL